MDKYVIDANVLIEAKNRYYAFDIVPSFWSVFEGHLKKKCILLSVVNNELLKGKDELVDWMKKVELEIYDNFNDSELLKEYAAVVKHIKECGKYDESAYKEWDNVNIADPWIIAYAKRNNSIILTHEGKYLYRKTDKKKLRIPAVASDLDIETSDLYDFMRANGIKI